jgi:AraC family transcriptional regulator
VSAFDSSAFTGPPQRAPDLIGDCAPECGVARSRSAGQGRAYAGARSLTVRFAPAGAVSRRIASWGNVTAEVVAANRRGRIEARFRAPVHMLALYERGVRRDGNTHVEGLAQSALRDCRGKMVFVPAGCEYYEWQEPRTLPRVAYLYLDPARLAAESQPSTMSIEPLLFFEDGALWDTASKLVALIEKSGSDNEHYAEALCVVLMHELTRLNAGIGCAKARAQGGLAAWRQQKIVDYIGEHLAAPIPLATLAQVVHLSPNYFCRAFKQSFGMPPQRYQIIQRIERAKTLLAGHASVTDIGFTVGYSETSAFSTAFRRVTGLSPSAYRTNAL